MRILHLSDLHFGFDYTETSKATRANYMRSLDLELERIASKTPFDYVLITGDIAWKAKSTDYDSAREYLSELLNKCGVSASHVFICPGNHDVDRSYIEDKIFPVSQADSNRWLNIERLDRISESFQEYIKFCKSMNLMPYAIGSQFSYLVGTASTPDINIISLNSAWYAQSKEVADKMWVGSSFLQLILNSDKIDLSKPTITIVHHPESKWNEYETSNYPGIVNTYKEFCKISDFVLSGHTHQIQCDPKLEQGAYVSGTGALYAESNYENAFYIYDITASKQIRTHYYYMAGEWKSDPEEPINGHRLGRRFIPSRPSSPMIVADYDKTLSCISFKSIDVFVRNSCIRSNADYPEYRSLTDADRIYQLFSQFLYSNGDPVECKEIIQNLKDHLSDSTHGADTMVLKGLQGTGKSSLMSLLYIDMLNNFRYSNTQIGMDASNGAIKEETTIQSANRLVYPIYLDVHKYMLSDNFLSETDLSRDIEQIISIIEENSSIKWLIFIDGIDAYENTSETYKARLNPLLEKNVGNIILCIGSAEDIRESRLRESGFNAYIDDAYYLAETRSIPIHSNKLESIVSNIKIITGINLNRLQNKALLKWITDYCGREIDFRTIYMLIKIASEIDDTDKIPTLSGKLELYYKRILGEQAKSFNRLASVTVSYLMSDMSFQKSKTISNSIWDVIHKNKLTRDYLFAYYFVQTIIGKQHDTQKHLGLIAKWPIFFPRTVNRFICDLLDSHNQQASRKLIDLYRDASHEMKANIGYLLGRISDPSHTAEEFLQKQWNCQIQRAIDGELSSSEFRLFRTIAISLICLGDESVEAGFLDMLTKNPIYANESFKLHCQYYFDNCEFISFSNRNTCAATMREDAMKELKKDINNILTQSGNESKRLKHSLKLDIVTYFSLHLSRASEIMRGHGSKEDVNGLLQLIIQKNVLDENLSRYITHCCYAYDLIVSNS